MANFNEHDVCIHTYLRDVAVFIGAAFGAAGCGIGAAAFGAAGCGIGAAAFGAAGFGIGAAAFGVAGCGIGFWRL